MTTTKPPSRPTAASIAFVRDSDPGANTKEDLYLDAPERRQPSSA